MGIATHRRAAAWLVIPLAAALAALSLSSPGQAQSSLRDAAAGQMLVGVAVTPDWLNNSTYANIVGAEFSSLTAENQMKMDALQPSPGNFNFGPGDQIVQFAQQNNQQVYGHTLVWHSQAPGWVQGLSGAELDQAMQNHITTVMQHYSGSVPRWDVANEVIDDNAQLRDSFWLQGLGEDYIAQAFRYARAADPGATLCLNDYSIDGINAKSTAYFNLVQSLLQQGVPIDCMGFQAHLILGQVPGDMQQNLQRFANLGLEIWITELDIRMNLPASPQNLEQQANEYAQVFQICQNVSACAGVTTWGLHEEQSWIPDFFDGQGQALMWDSDFSAKPAYFAVLQQLGGSVEPPPTDPPPTDPPPTDPPPAGDCQVAYQANDWGGSPGFTASVTLTNSGGSTFDGWTVQWDYPAGQSVDEPGWNAMVTQSGATVTAVNASWNGTVAPGASATFGFNGAAASAGDNPAPTAFTLNGISCSVA